MQLMERKGNGIYEIWLSMATVHDRRYPIGEEYIKKIANGHSLILYYNCNFRSSNHFKDISFSKINYYANGVYIVHGFYIKCLNFR